MSKLWKSFRFKIMLYSLLSLILALATEVTLVYGIFFVADYFTNDGFTNSTQEIVEQTVENEILEEGNKPKEPEKKEKKNAEKKEESSFGYSHQGDVTNEVIVATGSRKSFLMQIQQVKKFLFLLVTIAVLLYIGIFLLYFHLFTHKTSDYLAEISGGIDEIAKGDFHKSVRVAGEDEIANIAEKINNMTREIQILIENEREYEKEKSDLITNVAHDLRTPLTSIIGYLDLVRSKSELTNEEREKYVTIAFDKSKRLEKLINDLFEFTKVGAETGTGACCGFEF